MATIDHQPAPAKSTAVETMAGRSDPRRLDSQPAADGDGEGARAERLFSKSIVISGIRCVLAYLILPFATPFIGLAPGVGAGFGLIIGMVAIAANVFSIRRFWRADHRWKIPVTTLHVAVIGLLIVLVVRDVMELSGR